MSQKYEIGDTFDNRYQVTNNMQGEGGFGKVMAVIDLTTNEYLALKYCVSEDEEHTRRFKREVRIMESISHENVIKIIDSNVDHDPPYFTMPLAKNSLTTLIPQLKNNPERALKIFESICKGIQAIHNSNHTHRDIKPDNILLFEDDNVAVSDLGLAKLDQRDSTILTKTNIWMGSYPYMAPEQFTPGGTKESNHITDIYQLAKTLYHLLTGYQPMVLESNLVPIGIWYVIEKATRQRQSDRYQSVDEMLDALNDTIRASDPESSLTETFDQLLKTAKIKLQINQYDATSAIKMMQIITSLDNPDETIEFLHKIPDDLLSTYANHLPHEFEQMIIKYRAAINDNIEGYAFHFAESVAKKMNAIFHATTSSDIKRHVIISTLYAAVRLRRWAAMGVFDKMLLCIKDDQDAHSIAVGLREEIQDYSSIYSRLQKKELHPALQTVWELCDKA